MRNFYIKKLSLTGANVEVSSIDFVDGLNIICGPSDTGKSYIAECFDYMFGGKSKDFPISKDTGYDRVHMQLATYNGNITLERKFEDSHIKVTSLNPNFESGIYSTGKAKKTINSFWLQLIGIEEPITVIKKENFERQALTLRSFLHTFCIKEDNVFQKESIMFQKSVFSRTAIMSTLLYFITGDSYNNCTPQEAKAVTEARKVAVKNYIDSNLSYLATRKAQLTDFAAPSVEEVQCKINDILSEISDIEGEISSAVARSKELSNNILEINDQLAECNMLYNRYQVLRSQYQSDIKRLTFIVEGEIHKGDIPEVIRCPFCDGALQKHEEKSCIEAAQVELEKILPQLNDLGDAESDILFEQNELQEKVTQLAQERSDIESFINSELRPHISTLKKILSDYRHSIEVHREFAVIEDFTENITRDLYKIDENDEELEIKFKPKDHFSTEIRKRLDSILSAILKDCHFDNFSNAYFSLDSFDVVVNGKSKSSFGKGYRAFLNTVVALTFSEYLTEECEFSPTLLLIDSPILSLKEKDVDTSDSMKTSLFKYMVDNQGYFQTIIIENEIPNIDYSNVHVIKFSHDENEGRYGLLYGVRD